MRHDNSLPLTWPLRRASICVVEGYGVRVFVRNSQLVIEDGFGRERRRRVYSRATHGLSRVVLLGHDGFITLDAIRWMTDLGIAYMQLDRDGDVLTTSHFAPGDVRLRRAQALCATTTTGVEITRHLIRNKVARQAEVLEQLDAEPTAKHAIAIALQEIDVADSLDRISTAERQAALAYWSEWSDVELPFAKRDRQRLPTHWLTFGQRGSLLTAGPRNAINPANTLLNYLYAILEAETKTACLICGLDPGLGILHVDYRTRDSFVLDLMEPIRPHVDAYVLNLLQTHVFSGKDFGETRRGICRILAPLSHELATTGPRWRSLIAPIAETVASRLASIEGSRIDRLSTPLTGTNRATGRANIRRRPPSTRTAEPAKVAKRCHRCGGDLPHQRRVYCDDCLPHFQREQLERVIATASPVERLRTRTGADATHGGTAAKQRGETTATRKREIAEWEREYGKVVNPDVFTEKILPMIQNVPLSKLVRGTGLSLRYVSLIRRGERVPHPKHWQAFRVAGLPDAR